MSGRILTSAGRSPQAEPPDTLRTAAQEGAGKSRMSSCLV